MVDESAKERHASEEDHARTQGGIGARAPSPSAPGSTAWAGLPSDAPADELIAEIAHQFRSRFTSILCLAEAAYAAPRDQPETLRRRQAALLYSSAFTGSVLASNIMDLARGSEQPGPPEVVSIATILNAAARAVTPTAESRGLDVHVQPPDHDARMGHPVALERLAVNLAVAGLEFARPGRIDFAAEESADPATIAFRVRATTDPIDESILEALERPISPREAGGGWHWSPAGLALRSARAIAESLGGRLRLEPRAEPPGILLHTELHLPRVERPGVGASSRSG